MCAAAPCPARARTYCARARAPLLVGSVVLHSCCAFLPYCYCQHTHTHTCYRTANTTAPRLPVTFCLYLPLSRTSRVMPLLRLRAHCCCRVGSSVPFFYRDVAYCHTHHRLPAAVRFLLLRTAFSPLPFIYGDYTMLLLCRHCYSFPTFLLCAGVVVCCLVIITGGWWVVLLMRCSLPPPHCCPIPFPSLPYLPELFCLQFMVHTAVLPTCLTTCCTLHTYCTICTCTYFCAPLYFGLLYHTAHTCLLFCCTAWFFCNTYYLYGSAIFYTYFLPTGYGSPYLLLPATIYVLHHHCSCLHSFACVNSRSGDGDGRIYASTYTHVLSAAHIYHIL